MLALLFIVLMFLCDILLIEARVYCEDPNALNHTYVGYSCPLKCVNILTVIERLKVVDYHRLLKEDQNLKKWNVFENGEESLRRTGGQNSTTNETIPRTTRKIFNEYVQALANPKTLNYIQREFDFYGAITKLSHSFCRRTVANGTYSGGIFDNATYTSGIYENGTYNDGIYSNLYNQCLRRTPYQETFVRRLTKFLNRYAKAKFQFTKSMVVLFLRKLVGSNIDLRQGELIAPKVIEYLRQAMLRSVYKPEKVHLTSRHCLGIFVPGCFCKTGYIEEEGKCVSLEYCLKNRDKDLMNYYDRIVLH